MTPLHRSIASLLVGVFTGLAAPLAAADVILYETGFEAAEGFTAGQSVVGQDGWGAFLGANAAAARVTTANPRFGSQALAVDGRLLTESPPGSFIGAFFPLAGYDPLARGTPLVTIAADVRLEVLAGSTIPVRVGLLGTDADLLPPYAALTAGFDPDASGTVPPRVTSYESLRLVLDFRSRTFTGFVDAGLIFRDIPFFDATGTLFQPNLFVRGIGGAPSVVATFDNLRVTAAVPEPATLRLMAASLPWLILARRLARSRG